MEGGREEGRKSRRVRDREGGTTVGRGEDKNGRKKVKEEKKEKRRRASAAEDLEKEKKGAHKKVAPSSTLNWLPLILCTPFYTLPLLFIVIAMALCKSCPFELQSGVNERVVVDFQFKPPQRPCFYF